MNRDALLYLSDHLFSLYVSIRIFLHVFPHSYSTDLYSYPCYCLFLLVPIGSAFDAEINQNVLPLPTSDLPPHSRPLSVFLPLLCLIWLCSVSIMTSTS